MLKIGLFGLCGVLTTLSAVSFAAENINKDHPTSLTLMTYNIHVAVPMGKDIGKYTSGKKELDDISAVVNAANPHIVAFQEIDSEFGQRVPDDKKIRSELNSPRYIAEKTKMSYVFGSCMDDRKHPNAEYIEWGTPDHWKNNGKIHGESGNAVLVKSKFVEPPTTGKLPMDPNQAQRGFIRVEIPKSEFGEKIVVYGTHLHHNSEPTRVKQMTELLSVAKKDMDDSLVFIMGDLNQRSNDDEKNTTNPMRIAKNAGFHDLHKEFTDANGTTPELTCCQRPQTKRLDYILSNRKVKVLHAEVPHSDASDHYPVVVSIELPKK